MGTPIHQRRTPLVLPLLSLSLVLVLVLGCGSRRTAHPPDVRPGAVEARGEPSSRATEILRSCEVPDPPRACAQDDECAIVDIEHGACGGCAETLRVGVAAAHRAAFARTASCRRPQCEDDAGVACVVHWHHAEDGPADVPSGSEIVARCVKPPSATVGRCVTQYESGARP